MLIQFIHEMNTNLLNTNVPHFTVAASRGEQFHMSLEDYLIGVLMMASELVSDNINFCNINRSQHVQNMSDISMKKTTLE